MYCCAGGFEYDEYGEPLIETVSWDGVEYTEESLRNLVDAEAI